MGRDVQVVVICECVQCGTWAAAVRGRCEDVCVQVQGLLLRLGGHGKQEMCRTGWDIQRRNLAVLWNLAREEGGQENPSPMVL